MRIAGETLSFQLGKWPWSLGCPHELLYVAQLIGRIPASHRPAYGVICDMTPECRKPLHISVSQNVLLLQTRFFPFQPWLKPCSAPRNRIPGSLKFKNTFQHPTQCVRDWIPLDQLDLRGLPGLILSSPWHCLDLGGRFCLGLQASGFASLLSLWYLLW